MACGCGRHSMGGMYDDPCTFWGPASLALARSLTNANVISGHPCMNRTARPGDKIVRSLGTDESGPNMGRIAKIALGVGLVVWALSGITYQPRRSS